MNEEAPIESKEKPKCVMIALCDAIVEDTVLNKKVLFGLFNSMMVPNLPLSVGVVVIGSFAEGRGVWRLKIRIRDAEQRILFQFALDVKFSDPIEVYDYVFRVQNLTLTGEGVYDVDFFIDEEPISHRSF